MSKFSSMMEFAFEVDCSPCLSCLRCPFAVAMVSGKCLRTRDSVKPGHPMKWLFFMALRRVWRAGEKQVACI